MIKGCATMEGTESFTKTAINPKNYKKFLELSLSNVGIGTYLGEPDDKTDFLIKEAVKNSIKSGINVIDTAINYRAQKSERAISKAILELIQENKITREQIFVSTKNGYVTNDADSSEDFWKYVNQEYVQKGIINSGDITSGYHCMTIPYLEDQLNRSLKNLQLECVDLMYLHNAIEGQIKDVSKEEFIKNLQKVCKFYEEKRNEGKIKFYGLATWECFRVPEENPQFLSLAEVIDLAKEAGGENHGFRFIQLPYNLYLDQALLAKFQTLDGKKFSILELAQKFKIGVFTSVPFMQGRLLAQGAMPEFGNLKPSLRALQFIRSTPGVLAPLMGQKTENHVNENCEIMKIPPMEETEFYNLVKNLTK